MAFKCILDEKGHAKSDAVVAELENIDDECDQKVH